VLDLSSAPQLAGLLADEGHRAIVLDLGALNFIDVRGLGAITAAIHRLRPSGGTLEIQSPSPLAHRLFTLTATDQTLILGAPRVARPAPTQPEDAAAPAWDDAPLPPSLLDAALRWNPNEMLEVALRAVVLIARGAMSGSHGLSVSLRRDDRWVTVAATDRAVMALDQVADSRDPRNGSVCRRQFVDSIGRLCSGSPSDG
jgi:anti-anti-sigma factor